MDALVRPEGFFETRSASSAPGVTTTPATLLATDSASTTTPAALQISKGTIILAVVITLVALVIPLVVWAAYKKILARRRAASSPAPTPVSPMPLLASVRVVAATEVPAKFKEDQTMKSVRDFWSPISPGPPELHVEYKNLEVPIGTTVDPATTHLPLLTRDTSGFFYDSDHQPATPSTDTSEYTLKTPPSVNQGASPAAPEAQAVDQTPHHGGITTVPVVNDGGGCTRPSTPTSVRTVCTLASVSSSLSLHQVETPKEHSHSQRSVLGTVNWVPAIQIVEPTPEPAEKKLQGYAQRFNSRALTPKQAKLQNLI